MVVLHRVKIKPNDNNKLSTFIEMIPDKFEYIDHLKVDVVDEQVLESCGNLLDKFVVITTEKDCTKYLVDKGFSFLHTQPGGFSYMNDNKKDLSGNIDYKNKSLM